ncbi:16S rRNA (uracil(1498)-N(3))-methyltransferase [Mangrovicoccus algicola]|uniref:Ribosomal RNA small subunit methyltransferase E n=1 Tax=Mangrovicoccus algicola TaxID=2771008 RepID=A0A8J6Z8X9_9RHOB|nr:16S rRNA (uracil(1498)-N(3))-methyltransferase [Mangrovicoccus algicola]MBE3638066.1 16S rRNA (uracil(1498)-N(3))-methyltransferase [Mangrovicoccus algicola]
MALAKIRLFLEHPMAAGQTLPLAKEQAHYLFGVMRLAAGDRLPVFNGQDGEWIAEVAEAGKRGGSLTCLEQSAPLRLPPDLWLAFAPIKKERTDFITEKATELGAARIIPVQTDFTNSARVNRDRLQAHAVEAAEQCGGTFVPEVAGMTRLGEFLDACGAQRQIMFCDETLTGETVPARQVLAEAGRGPWAVLIGPEGGFSQEERDKLHALPFAHPVSLGPRILRADTAAVAALTLWQDVLGDWNG